MKKGKATKKVKMNNNRFPIVSSVCVIIIIAVCFLFAFCYNKDSGIVRWQMSEEALTLVQDMKEHPDYYGKDYLIEENYASTIEALYARGETQVFPEVETVNTLEKVQFGSNDIYTLSQNDYENIVIYIHGGAYVYEITGGHIKFADKLATELNAKVYLPIYPLAPQASYAEAYNMLDNLYDSLLLENKKIFIMGDSAGGGLSLAFVEHLKANNIDLPEKVVLISPWLDVTCSNEKIAEYEEKDLTLALYALDKFGAMWAGGLDMKDPLISPLYGDIVDLPDVMMFVATDEIMYPDVYDFYNMLKKVGNNAKLVIGDGYWHGFPVYSSIPESVKSVKAIKEFCL